MSSHDKSMGIGPHLKQPKTNIIKQLPRVLFGYILSFIDFEGKYEALDIMSKVSADFFRNMLALDRVKMHIILQVLDYENNWDSVFKFLLSNSSHNKKELINLSSTMKIVKFLANGNMFPLPEVYCKNSRYNTNLKFDYDQTISDISNFLLEIIMTNRPIMYRVVDYIQQQIVEKKICFGKKTYKCLLCENIKTKQYININTFYEWLYDEKCGTKHYICTGLDMKINICNCCMKHSDKEMGNFYDVLEGIYYFENIPYINKYDQEEHECDFCKKTIPVHGYMVHKKKCIMMKKIAEDKRYLSLYNRFIK